MLLLPDLKTHKASSSASSNGSELSANPVDGPALADWPPENSVFGSCPSAACPLRPSLSSTKNLAKSSFGLKNAIIDGLFVYAPLSNFVWLSLKKVETFG